MRVIILGLIVACAYASPQYTKTAGVKGGGGRRYFAGENIVKYNNTYAQNTTNYNSREVGVCYVEVPTASLVRDPAHVPAGNGSRSDLSRIRTCCSGYVRNIHNFRLCDPICSTDCVNALCTAPETCTCFPDHVKNLGGFCIPTCPIGCQNGNCAGGECVCKNGYRLDSEGKFCIPVCRENCGGLGNCTAPNTCECRRGYKSSPEGSCKPECNKCVDGECVAPNDCRCRPGYSKNQNGDCVNPQSVIGLHSDAETHRPNQQETTTPSHYPYQNPNQQRYPNQQNHNQQYPNSQYPNQQNPQQYPTQQQGNQQQYYPYQQPKNPDGQQTYYAIYSQNNPRPENQVDQQPYYSGGQQPNYPGRQPYNTNPNNHPGYPNSKPSGYPENQHSEQSTNIYNRPSNYPDNQQANYPGRQPYNTNSYNHPDFPTNIPSNRTENQHPGQSPTYIYIRPSNYPDNQQSNVNQSRESNYPIQQNYHLGQPNYPGQYPTQFNPYTSESRPDDPWSQQSRPSYQYPDSQLGNVEVLCSTPCINGTCVGHDRCSCYEGFVPVAGDSSGTRCQPYCPSCSNGVCVSPYVCSCNPGYYMDHSVKGRARCTKRIRRSLESNEDIDKNPVNGNVAELLVFEIPEDY